MENEKYPRDGHADFPDKFQHFPAGIEKTPEFANPKLFIGGLINHSLYNLALSPFAGVESDNAEIRQSISQASKHLIPEIIDIFLEHMSSFPDGHRNEYSYR